MVKNECFQKIKLNLSMVKIFEPTDGIGMRVCQCLNPGKNKLADGWVKFYFTTL